MPSSAFPAAWSGSFDAWLEAPVAVRKRGRSTGIGSGGVRFAFYGRISTVEYQDPVSSRAWQIEAAGRVVAGQGRIVAEFFDSGTSRSLPWARRQALLLMLGHQSEREVLRNRFRTNTAMAAQVRDQGRNLGGRPPYGYRLVDDGPHPKPMHAAWGRRRHRLDVDPATAGTVKWIFARRLDGMSTAGIARSLNERGVSSPGVCTTMTATGTGATLCGRCGRWRRCWRTPGTPVGKCGTGSSPTTVRRSRATNAPAPAGTDVEFAFVWLTPTTSRPRWAMRAMVDPLGIRPGAGSSAGGRRLARRSQSSTGGGSLGTRAGSWTPADRGTVSAGPARGVHRRGYGARRSDGQDQCAGEQCGSTEPHRPNGRRLGPTQSAAIGRPNLRSGVRLPRSEAALGSGPSRVSDR
jgi:hypothetical protein